MGIYKNNGYGTFSYLYVEPDSDRDIYYDSFIWGDYNDDGKSDIAICGWYTNGSDVFFRIYENTILAENNPPLTPTGLMTEDVGGYWRLSWDPTYDDHTPQTILQYHIAVGTNQSGVYDYISSNFTYSPGNANIGNVPNATACYYQTTIPVTTPVYWKVAAADGAFKYSAYSAESGSEFYPTVTINPSTNVVVGKPFNAVLYVDANYGYYSTNGIDGPYIQFNTSGVSVRISTTTMVYYYGNNGMNSSPTNSIEYVVLCTDNFLGTELIVGPNPAVAGSLIRFQGLTPKAEIAVYTAAGEAVIILEETSGDGVYTWDGNDGEGKRLAPGVYYCVITNPDDPSDKCILKMSIIK